jgi:NAD+ synthase (glutamine-hydrolysing)
MSYDNCLYNVVALIHNHEILGFVAKQELAGDGIYYEPRWFKRWKEEQVVMFNWDGQKYPFGDVIFEIDGVRIGFEICEDAWSGIRPAQRHYLHNVDIILNPSASNFAFGKSQVRERLVTETSRAYACVYVYSNLLGNEAGRIIYDGEVLIAKGGELMARNKRFSFSEYQLLSAVLDIDRPRTAKRKSFNFEPTPAFNCVRVESHLPNRTYKDEKPVLEKPVPTKEMEFYLAETLALWDYMRKSRSKGFVLSLSGGADSSCCAVLCAKTFERAYKELGPDLFLRKIAYMRLPEADCASLSDITRALLTCVYQATRNSGTATLASAKELAQGIDASFHAWDVEPLHEKYIQLAETTLGRPLSWETDDLTLQNVQARLRSPGIWMLANLSGGLLLTTSNRSEAAVGYATMDGDTSGGLAPLGGVDKAFIISWLKWAESALQIPHLSYVNNLAPTAELRPNEYHQTDEDDLMPYDVLDAIENSAIGDYKSPTEVFITLRGFNNLPDVSLKTYIRKFYTLWSRNQWKRERYAPCFHVDDRNLDPKTWCRFPILNGGFAEALADMQAYEPIE